MKYVCVVVALLLAGIANAQADVEIRRLLEAQQNAWNNGDIEGFMEHYWKSDSLRFMTQEKVTKGWQQTLDRYKKGYPDRQSMGALEFDIISIEQLCNDAALVTGHWLVTSRNERNEGHFNLLWRKKNGRWVIVLDHTS
jgi:uncharacterized protein (TIGR02246 family)